MKAQEWAQDHNKKDESQKKKHWDDIYSSKGTQGVSWYQPHAEQSLRLIRDAGIGKDAAIIDVGGGASTLVDDLLAEGYTDLSVLDFSAAALAAAKQRLGAAAQRVHWIEADITQVKLPANAFDLWHDRAVFHFLTSPEDRTAYVDAVLRAVKPGGHVIAATFGEEGPLRCSGLPVVRYRPDQLEAEFGDALTLLDHQTENHLTPWGGIQQFVYCYFRKGAPRKDPAKLRGDDRRPAAP